MGYGDLITQQLRADDPIREGIETIRHAAERAAALTRQLLVFSRRQTFQPTVLDVNQVLSDLVKMLRRLIDENISLTVTPETEIWHIKADSGYIGQVLLNLVVNARDAKPNGGELGVATRNISLPGESRNAPADAPAGDYDALSVADTGVGMTPEVKMRLFEAFFTTKPKGKGTGLGLATCHTIVKECGGFISVQSEVGKGTTFDVYFPRVDLPLDIVVPYAANTTLPGGTETVLLVEDEPAVRHLACDVLEGRGYRVLRASNGKGGVARGPRVERTSHQLGDYRRCHASNERQGHGRMAQGNLSGPQDSVHLRLYRDSVMEQEMNEPGVAFLPNLTQPRR